MLGNILNRVDEKVIELGPAARLAAEVDKTSPCPRNSSKTEKSASNGQPHLRSYTDIPLYVNRSAGETDEDMLAAVQRQAAKNVRRNYNNTDAKMLSALQDVVTDDRPADALESYVDGTLKTDNMKATGTMRLVECRITATEIVWQRRVLLSSNWLATTWLKKEKGSKQLRRPSNSCHSSKASIV